MDIQKSLESSEWTHGALTRKLHTAGEASVRVAGHGRPRGHVYNVYKCGRVKLHTALKHAV